MRKLVPSSNVNSRTGTDFMETEYLLPFYKKPVNLYSEPYESSPVLSRSISLLSSVLRRVV